MKFHHFCPPYDNSWLHLVNSTIAPLWYTMFDYSWSTGEPQCFDQVRINYTIASNFGDLRWNTSLAHTSKAWLTWKILVQLLEVGGGNCLPWLRVCMPMPEISSYRGSWGERSCPRDATAFHSMSVNLTHNLPIVKRTLCHWAIVAPVQSSSLMPRCQVMLWCRRASGGGAFPPRNFQNIAQQFWHLQKLSKNKVEILYFNHF